MERSSWRLQALWVLLALLAFAGMIARLRRVPRPRFDPDVRYAGGRLAFGRVVIARAGERGRTVGWAVTCDGSEVLSRVGERSLRVTGFGADRVTVLENARGTTATVFTDPCRVVWNGGGDQPR